MGIRPRFNEQQLRAAVAASNSVAETLRRLGYCHTGGNPITVKKYAARWDIDTSHFDPDSVRNAAFHRPQIPLEQILVVGSTYNRGHLKPRLYDEGLKKRECELCGQGEIWNGDRMALILDHINGERDDNRNENLRIVCPNCAATLPTHCGKGLRKAPVVVTCRGCGAKFTRKYKQQSYCSRGCGQLARWQSGIAQRRVERPPYEQLIREITETSYSAVGRKYGVSDNAVRKWVRVYERERARSGEDAA